jgi:glycosyltransferase involved in cell wall biosynthesis
VKSFDLGILRNVEQLVRRDLIGGFYYYNKMLGLKSDSTEKTVYLMEGDMRCLNVWLILILSKLINKTNRTVLWTHGYYGRENDLITFIKLLFFRLSDSVLVYNNYSKNLIVKKGIPHSKITVVYNSLSQPIQLDGLKELKFESNRTYFKIFGNDYPVIFFCGRIEPTKKLNLLLDAHSKINNEGLDCNLCIVGEGEDLIKIQQKVSSSKYKRRVHFWGDCYNEQTLAELFYSAAVTVSPGNIGLLAMHSMCYGTPVVTHNRYEYQMPEFESIMDKVTGSFFEYDDINSLSNELKNWLFLDFKDREIVRRECMHIVAEIWNSQNQINIFKDVIEKLNN